MLANLPAELQLDILARVDVADLVRCRRLNRAFNLLIHDNRDWIAQHITLRHQTRLCATISDLDFRGVDILTALGKYDAHFDVYFAGGPELTAKLRHFAVLFAEGQRQRASWINRLWPPTTRGSGGPVASSLYPPQKLAETMMRIQYQAASYEYLYAVSLSDTSRLLPSRPDLRDLWAAIKDCGADVEKAFAPQDVSRIFQRLTTARPLGSVGPYGPPGWNGKTEFHELGLLDRELGRPDLPRYARLRYVSPVPEGEAPSRVEVLVRRAERGLRISLLEVAAALEDIVVAPEEEEEEDEGGRRRRRRTGGR